MTGRGQTIKKRTSSRRDSNSNAACPSSPRHHLLTVCPFIRPFHLANRASYAYFAELMETKTKDDANEAP